MSDKVYQVFLRDPDTDAFTQLVGVFSELDYANNAVAEAGESLGFELFPCDYEIEERTLNYNFITHSAVGRAA